MRYLFLLILISVSVGAFIKFVQPLYKDVQGLRSEVTTSGGSLNTAQIIKKERDDLIAKYNGIQKVDLDNLETLLPDTVNNIRLIIQINALANRNNLSTLRNVDYQTNEKKDPATPAGFLPADDKLYGEFTISFQTSGQYNSFLNFISDLEQNLRLVDITAVDFSSSDPTRQSSMNYKVTLKTYWLKK
jgi:Tfp pilus assembly protein PilO